MPIATSPTPYRNNNNNKYGADDDDANAEDIDLFLLELELGEGAIRFAPKSSSGSEQTSLYMQLQSLTKQQRHVFDSLKSKWIERCRHKDKVAAGVASTTASSNNPMKRCNEFPDYMILRFARTTASVVKDKSTKGTTAAASAANSSTTAMPKNDTMLKFNESDAWKAMKKYKHRYLHMTCHKMEEQLLSKVRRDFFKYSKSCVFFLLRV